jgi:hypothetical protein
MANIVENKYYLKTVHEEIGLFDRKLAHLLKYDVFESDAAKDAAVRKLARKRETLVETAKRMAAEGIEFKPSDLPTSIRPEGMEPIAAAEPVKEIAAAEADPAAAAAGAGANRSARRQNSVYAGTSLDWEQSVRNYMQSKTKA